MFKLSDAITQMFSTDKGCEIYNRILDTLHSENMTNIVDKGLLVGFSGGPDSVFLLSFLNEYKRRDNKDFKILAVHVNHCIRGKEADRDESFAKEFADSLGIEFESISADIPKQSKELGIGIEEAARNARYSIFSDLISSRTDISAITVAHNATDNAETVLMNILRGSGLSGVCGIKPIRDNIIRPLIKIAKEDILSVLDASSIPYVTDSSNFSVDYTRNYVRNEIMPLLKRLSDTPESSFTKLTDNLRSDLDYINSQAKSFILESSHNQLTSIKLRGLHPSVKAKVLSMLVFDKTGEYPEEKHISAISKLLNTDNFRYSLPGKYDFVCERGVCAFFDKIMENRLAGQIFSLNEGENKISGTNLTVFVGEVDKSSLNVYNFSIQAHISSAIIKDGLFLRFRIDGDSYKYFGMTHKLKKVFNDRNIPASQRDFIPILCDKNGILVVPGMSERDGAKSDISKNNTPITFAYSQINGDDIEVFSALLRR